MTSAAAVGDMAPDFELQDARGERVRLSSFRGEKCVVLFFYPKDHTAGCTVEVCSFRDAHDEFAAAGAVLLGVSEDGASSHESFTQRHGLPFRLLCDPDGHVAQRYGLTKAFGVVPDRVTFVIDAQGVIRHVTVSRLRFRKHVTDALDVVRALSQGAAQAHAPAAPSS